MMDGFSSRPRAAAPRGRRGLWFGVGLLFSALLAAGCGQNGQEKKIKPLEVTVTTPILGEVRDYQDFTGRLMAVKSVDVRARVQGYVLDVPFKEGDLVKEGQVLFEIDPSTYKADLNLAKANLKLAEAEVALMERNAQRAQRLIGRSAVAQEDYETTMATLEKDRATVDSMKASRDKADLYAKWTTVKAPISGRVSRRLVDPGNLVTADSTILTTIVTENPLYAYFDVDERTFLDLVGAASQAPTGWLSALNFPVLMRLANEDDFTQVGKVDFLDNQVSPTTGTIKMRGVFQNPRGHLKSGLFARVRLPIGDGYQATLVPDEALQSDQGRKFVYVIEKGKNKKGEDVDLVVYRRVLPGQAVTAKVTEKKGDETRATTIVLRVLRPYKVSANGKEKEGVLPNEQVIIVGQQRVRPKMEVLLKKKAPPPPPENPFGKLLQK
jgi:RND family efflux transporter MFP subunit